MVPHILEALRLEDENETKKSRRKIEGKRKKEGIRKERGNEWNRDNETPSLVILVPLPYGSSYFRSIET